MKVWHRSKGEEFGKTLLVWRHQTTSHFVNKIGSWLLGGFVMGILASIILDTIGLPDLGKYAGRVVFFIVFFIGVVSAFFRNIVHGLHYRITEKALIFVRPVCGIESLTKSMTVDGRSRWDRVEFLTWEEIKSVQDSDGHIVLTLKGDETVQIEVTPVRSIGIAGGNGVIENRTHAKGVFGHDADLDKEALRHIVQRIREIKKQVTGK